MPLPPSQAAPAAHIDIRSLAVTFQERHLPVTLFLADSESERKDGFILQVETDRFSFTERGQRITVAFNQVRQLLPIILDPPSDRQ
jgi:hypothetical protein